MPKIIFKASFGLKMFPCLVIIIINPPFHFEIDSIVPTARPVARLWSDYYYKVILLAVQKPQFSLLIPTIKYYHT